MNARERAIQAIESSTIPPEHYQWWALVVSREQTQALIRAIEQAIITAEEAKAMEEREACAMIVDEQEKELTAAAEKIKQQSGLKSVNHAAATQVAFAALLHKQTAEKIRTRSEG